MRREEENMNEMPIESAHHLMMMYPGLGNYIQESFNQGNYEELIDFLFALEKDNHPTIQ